MARFRVRRSSRRKPSFLKWVIILVAGGFVVTQWAKIKSWVGNLMPGKDASTKV